MVTKKSYGQWRLMAVGLLRPEQGGAPSTHVSNIATILVPLAIVLGGFHAGLDLANDSFIVPLVPESQDQFAFKWEG